MIAIRKRDESPEPRVQSPEQKDDFGWALRIGLVALLLLLGYVWIEFVKFASWLGRWTWP